MLIQILKEYKNRTEYSILNNFYTCQIVSIYTLEKGTLIIPGILLNKMQKEEINILNAWLRHQDNQLILLPAWREVNLGEYFNTSVGIIVKKTEGSYHKIPLDYEIEAAVKEKVFFENGKTFGINYRNNLSSGLITVVTLPLLDYKMMDFEDEFKNCFSRFMQGKACTQEKFEKNNDKVDIDNVHVFLIILLAAGVQLDKDIASNIFKNFGAKIEEEILSLKYKELVRDQYINDKKLMDKGMKITVEKNLKAFINVIKERRENKDGWH